MIRDAARRRSQARDLTEEITRGIAIQRQLVEDLLRDFRSVGSGTPERASEAPTAPEPDPEPARGAEDDEGFHYGYESWEDSLRRLSAALNEEAGREQWG